MDPDSRTVYMTSWIDDESSEYLYMYNLDSGDYKGKLKLDPAPKWLQGVAYYNGSLYLTSDDGDADKNEPDHMYKVEVSEDKETGCVTGTYPLTHAAGKCHRNVSWGRIS